MSKLIYEGKSKRVYELGPTTLLLEFKDEVTAFDGRYKDKVSSKGALSAAVTAKLFEVLEASGVRTHYICYLGDRFIKVKKCEAIPLEVIVRNYAYGSFLKRMPLVESLKKFNRPLVEFHYKSDELHDPLILEQDILESGLLNEGELKKVKVIALKVNEVLTSFWKERGLKLVDFKIEIGKDIGSGELLVIDDLSGDAMRVITSSGGHLDKEVYRRTKDVNLLIEAYRRLSELAGDPSILCNEGDLIHG